MNRILIASVALLAGAYSALAQHAGDILLQNIDGRLVTGAVSEEGEIVERARVFVTEFGLAPNFTNEPGIDSEVGEFAAGTSIGFTIRRAVRVWDGSTFGKVSEERISMALGPLGPVSSPVNETPVAGFATSVASNGEFHRHFGYTLQSPARDGVYLLELELWMLDASLTTSLPFWIVFGQNAEQVDVDAAAAWAQANLADVCIADFNRDGFLDFNDFDAFVAAFEEGAATADITGDGFLTFDDFDAFVLALEAGC